MVELKIEIARDEEDTDILCASLKTDDEIIAGYGETPYDALRDLINELEYQHQYFRED